MCQIFHGDGIVTTVEIRGSSVAVKTLRMPTNVMFNRVGFEPYPENYNEIVDAEKAIRLGLPVSVPAPVYGEPAFKSFYEFEKFVNGLYQEFVDGEVRFVEPDLDGFPEGGVRFNKGRYVYALCDGGRRTYYAYLNDESVEWAEARLLHDPETADFIDRLIVASDEHWRHVAAKKEEEEKKRLAKMFGVE